MRPEPVRKSLCRTASFSKANRRCPARVRCFSPVDALALKMKKPPDSGGFSHLRTEPGLRLKPLGAASSVTVAAGPAIAVVTAVPVTAAISAVVALKAAMPPAFTAETAFHVGQDRKAALLAE